MTKRTFVCLFHASDCSEECEVVVERLACWCSPDDAPERCVGCPDAAYRLVEYPASCKCGRPVPHCDPPQEELRRAWHHPEAEDA